MGVGFWILGVGLVGAVACLAYGRKNGGDIDDVGPRISHSYGRSDVGQ